MSSRAVVLVAALALFGAACGSADESVGVASADRLVSAGPATDQAGADAGGSSDSVEGAIDTEQALLSFTECMREEGIEMSDPVVDADGNLRLDLRSMIDGDVDRDLVRAAREACGGLLEGVAQRFEEADRTEIEDRLLAFAACMRDNGIDMPDPDFGARPGSGGGAPGGGPFGLLDPDDPAFQEALEVCQGEFGDLRLPTGGGFGGGRGPGGGGAGGTP
jgi:hypothetical protein